ncbi:hypothetical protein F511_46850 [Dorcoceras hygrometricum]|uniref:Uncharacterized protein n=1 Tax=Dorcoceras hygrometricum TaxID=472368 RepID=A0A2Z6ZSF3_9LAMI|nr:hypothetical protein F511_46850 [Dorcoceras hygrometricum]
MRREAKELKRRRVEESADDLKEQSQESAAGRHCVANQSQDTSWKHMFNTSWTTRRKQQQHPVESLCEPAVAIYPVASYSGSSRKIHPVDLDSQTQEKKK